MGLFSKKKKGESIEENSVSLPDLPDDLELPSIGDLGSPKSLPDLEPNELPPLPNSVNHPTNSVAIKSEINRPHVQLPSEEVSPVPVGGLQKSRFQIVESPHQELPVRIGHGNPSASQIPKTPNVEYEEPVPQPREFKQEVRKNPLKSNEPIYIRLDKFKTTLESFEDIKEKVEDIEKLLIKIKDIREQEDKELNEWELEIQMIKTRIETIDKNIFDKLD